MAISEVTFEERQVEMIGALHDAFMPIPDECPAGGEHQRTFLTAWGQGVGLYDPMLRSGWFCEECGEPLPAPGCDEEPYD